MKDSFVSSGLRLHAHVARPANGRGPRRPAGVILCHGFPAGPRGAATSAQTYPDLADRVAAGSGLVAMAFNFRGAGESEGDFSLGGWLDDLHAAVDFLVTTEEVNGVWLAGFSTGGALALCVAAEDDRVRGVAALSAPADFHDWAANPRRFLLHAREVGVIRSPAFPADVDAWARDLREIRPVAVVGKIPPRPLLVMHGSDDDDVPVADARVLADAADDRVELRIVTGAAHRLRHDPRAMSILLGWLGRQAG